MRKIFTILVLTAFVCALATSCKHHESCPAYGKAGSAHKHRSV